MKLPLPIDSLGILSLNDLLPFEVNPPQSRPPFVTPLALTNLAFVQQTGALNPFDGIDVGEDSIPSFADLDGDGDLDGFVGEQYGAILFFENIGSATQPNFAEQGGATNPFDGFFASFGYSSPSFADLDGDGDLDAAVGNYYPGSIQYLENTGNSTAPNFVERTGTNNPFDGIFFDRLTAPSFGDFDGDGDQDALLGEGEGTLAYFENVGNATTPSLIRRTGVANPFNGVDVGFFSKPTVGDLDGDGDLDVVVGESEGNLNVFENVGTATSPSFTQQTGTSNPLNGLGVDRVSAPRLADLDGDGDLDTVIGAEDGTISFLENLTLDGNDPPLAVEDGAGISVGLGGPVTINVLANDREPEAETIVLLSFDGTSAQGGTILRDDQGTPTDLTDDRLIYTPPTTGLSLANPDTFQYDVEDGSGQISTGTVTVAALPPFVQGTHQLNPLNGVDAGSRSKPSFADLDQDGDLDLSLGNRGGGIQFFENTGDGANPNFIQQSGAASPWNGVDVGFNSAPTFVDLDGDGDLDSVVGEANSALNLFENTGTATNPILTPRNGAANPFSGLSFDTYTTPAFADIDGDGDFDAFVGKGSDYDPPYSTRFVGGVDFFENVGSATSPSFLARGGAANPFDRLDLAYNSTPSFNDLDGDGDLDAFVGEKNGTLQYFENAGNATQPNFIERSGSANPFNSFTVGSGDSAPTFADVDGDGDQDAFVGAYNGVITFLENFTVPRFEEVSGTLNPFTGFDAGNLAVPSFGDLDGDGDRDGLVGNLAGELQVFQNDGAGNFVGLLGAANPLDGVTVGVGSSPALGDLDGDGDQDVVVGGLSGTLAVFRNDGGGTFSSLTGLANPFDGVDVGAGSSPALGDGDNDGDLDVVVGNSSGTLAFLRNDGGSFSQQTGAANPFDGLALGVLPRVTFQDGDGDGDSDLLVGDQSGTLAYYRQDGTGFTAAPGGLNPLSGFDVGQFSAPAFGDLDGDGDIDLGVGNGAGNLVFFANALVSI